MSVKQTIPVFYGTTDAVDEKLAFEYWRSMVLSTADVKRLDPDRPFSASRMIARSAQGGVIRTISRPYSLERKPNHVRRDGQDDVGISLILQGRGYIEQGHNGALLDTGDIMFQTWARPGGGGALTDFEDLRLLVPTATFESQIGNVKAFAGTRIPAGPLTALFAAYMRGFAATVADMTEAETGIAVEGALHLLRGAIHSHTVRADDALSTNALRSLALARIESRLHDPSFGPETLAADLRVSRSRLYTAFAGGEGIAGTIRAARLDRARDRILRARRTGCRIASIMAGCGYTDPAAFSRAFRQRFGLSPRDFLAQGDG